MAMKVLKSTEGFSGYARWLRGCFAAAMAGTCSDGTSCTTSSSSRPPTTNSEGRAISRLSYSYPVHRRGA